MALDASTTVEDDPNLDNVSIDLPLIHSFSIGFLRMVKPFISIHEVKSLFDSFFLMSIEVAMRFLDDFISGDLYFKTDSPSHNLIRAKNQIKLVKEIISNKSNIISTFNSALSALDFPKDFFI